MGKIYFSESKVSGKKVDKAAVEDGVIDETGDFFKKTIIEAVKKLVKNIATNYTLPYFTITPTFSICPKHGYISGEHHFCPKCDAEMGYNEKNSKTRVEVKFEEDEEGVINNESQAMNIETASNENIDSLTKPAFDIERNLIQAIA